MAGSKQPNPFRLGTKVATGAHGTHSEKRIAKSVGARLTPGSGSKRGAKGDSIIAGKTPMMIESKSTINASLSVEFAWLVKLSEEALTMAKTPVFTMSFVQGDGKARRHGDWVAMPLHVFRELVDELPR